VTAFGQFPGNYANPQPVHPQAFAPAPTQQYPQYPQQPVQQFQPVAGGGMPQGFPGQPAAGSWGMQQPMPYPSPQQQPLTPVATGTIADFMAQRQTLNGRAWTFNIPGETKVGIVTGTPQVIQDRDKNTQQPATYSDGSPKWVMVIPLQEPDGTEVKWYVRGSNDGTGRVELQRAMMAQGLAEDVPPEEGAVISVTFHGKQAKTSGPNSFVQNVFSVSYDRRYVQAPAPAPPQQPAQQFQPPAAPAEYQPPANVHANGFVNGQAQQQWQNGQAAQGFGPAPTAPVQQQPVQQFQPPAAPANGQQSTGPVNFAALQQQPAPAPTPAPQQQNGQAQPAPAPAPANMPEDSAAMFAALLGQQ
jgi:hypothetical protein